MAMLLALLRPLAWINERLLAVGRTLAVVALALMVGVILAQVVARYVVGDALAWSEEAARFGMLWMTGLIAPMAYRRGGFVAIDMLERALPPRAGAALALGLLVVSLGVIAYALPLGAAHVQSGCLFRSSSLYLPFTLEFGLPLPGTGLALTLCSDAPALALEWGWHKMPLAVMFASLYVGLQLLLSVNVELILRALVAMLGGEDRLGDLAVTEMAGAE